MRYPAGFISAFYNPLKNPDAPTIGTATGGSGSASVAFTAPANVGGSAITSYTAISTPSGFTGTAASSPITVSGLAESTAYTFTVFATNSYGSSVLSAASNSATTLPAIGGAYGGGFFAGQISTVTTNVASFNLVIGPLASAQSFVAWKNANTATTGADSVINGPQNTADMVAAGSSTVFPAAHFCNDLSTGGQTDWYMPAQNELEVCYYNLKPTTQSNSTSYGINANAIPARASNYTAGNPAQTSAADFKNTGTEDFANDFYWSSTEVTSRGLYIAFYTGQQFVYSNTNNRYVRAVRRVAV
jgi:hypothetical protein